MKLKYTHYSFFFCLLLAMLVSCKKEFLNALPDKSLLVPTTPGDFQALLDNTTIMNVSPEIGLIASDEYSTTSEGLGGLATQTEKNSYLWAGNVYEGESVTDWNAPYQQIFYCNVVLDGLQNTGENTPVISGIKGSALFFRGLAYYNLVQVFTAAYSAETAGREPGVPVRTEADVNVKSVRGTLQQSYDQLLSDVKASVSKLPLQAAYKSRPTRAAAYALLARIYLTMSVYDKARAYADSALALNSKLNSYNNYNPTDYRPFPVALPNANDEIIFATNIIPYSFDEASLTFADSTLYQSYAANDLRKSLYFVDSGLGGMNFQGSYSGNYYLFNGLATDELYLIRAEANARLGHSDLAVTDLNTLLVTRYQPGTFVPYQIKDSALLLKTILTERRKELFSRGLRWSDLRRLNRDPLFAVTLSRVIDGKSYTLLPNDQKYVFPIPDDEIRSSGIAQNPR